MDSYIPTKVTFPAVPEAYLKKK